MGKIKYKNKIRKFFEVSPVVSMNSIKKFINKRNKDYVYLIINNLIKREEINRITKGFYTIYHDPSLIVFCLKPSYLGLQDALSAHNLWEQETNPVVITVKKIRPGIRKVFNNNVVIRRINSKYFLGVEYIKQGDFYLPYSDIEKTFIDMVYFKENLNREILKEIKNKINMKKFNSYIKAYPKKFKNRVRTVLEQGVG